MKTVFSKKFDLITFECKLSDDRLKLFIDLTPKFTDANRPNTETSEELRRQVCNALEEFISPDLIDTDVLHNALSEALTGVKVEQRRIAKGQAPGEPRNGKVVFLVKKLGGASELKTDDKGKVNFRELHLFDNIELEQIVARIYPAHKGADGKDALGQTLPGQEGKPAVFSIDKTLELKPATGDQQYATLHAKVAGVLFQNSEKLTVLEELRIKGDVDYSCGNIDFIGSVIVDGSVHPGFKIKARKNIEVKGNCDSATLESTEGSITVQGTSSGTPETMLKAAKDVVLKSAQNQKVQAGENIVVTKEARNCLLEAQSLITMPTAVLLAGQATVVCGLEAAELGNEVGVKTGINVSSSMEMGVEYHKLTQSKLAHERAIALVDLHLGPLASNISRIQFLKPELRKKMQALADKKAALSASLKKLEADVARLLQGGRRSQLVRINYLKALYPGVTLAADDQEFSVTEPLTGPGTIEFSLGEKLFKAQPWQALECVFEAPNQSNNPIGEKKDEPK